MDLIDQNASQGKGELCTQLHAIMQKLLGCTLGCKLYEYLLFKFKRRKGYGPGTKFYYL